MFKKDKATVPLFGFVSNTFPRLDTFKIPFEHNAIMPQKCRIPRVASINLVDWDSKKRQHRLDRLFLLSAWRFDTRRVEKLLDAGARIEAQPGNGWTAFFQAAYIGDIKTAMMLIGRGASFSKKDGSGHYVDEYWNSSVSEYRHHNVNTNERKAFLHCLRIFRLSNNKRGMKSFFYNFNECVGQ